MTSVTRLPKEKLHRGLSHSFMSTNLMSHPLQLMASSVIFFNSPSCRNLGTRFLLRGESCNTLLYEQAARRLTCGPHGTVPRFEPIQTGQTHSNAIQTSFNEFKFIQTLTKPKSIFPLLRKIQIKYDSVGFEERNNFFHRHFFRF
jgi:hypothetical protein